MIICITGDKNYKKKYEDKLRKDILSYSQMENVCFIFGDCSGVDAIARKLCLEYKVQHLVYKAKWNKYGKKAGYKRNKKMIKQNPDIVIGYHDNIETSKGAKMCLNLAKEKGIVTLLNE